jgi:hypothetical protein
MSSDPSHAYKTLRDALREPIQDVQTLIELVKPVNDRFLDPSSSESSKSISAELKVIKRFLPSIHSLLLGTVLPNYHHLLDDEQTSFLRQLFVPPKRNENVAVFRAINLTSYLSLPPLLTQQANLPVASRGFLLETLARLDSIDGLYWAVWSSANDDTPASKSLLWDEAIKSCLTLPSKAANAVGRWRNDGWQGDLPDTLTPK